jgi:hypothetical protein
MNYEILTERLDKVQKLVKKIQKKGGDVTYTEGEPFLKKVTFTDKENQERTITVEVTPVELEATFKIEGFTPVALVEHLEEGKGNIVTPFGNSVKVPHKYYSTAGYCDHCHTNHRRKQTILLQKDDEIRQVGLSCLLDYTGVDASYLATVSQYFREFEECEEVDWDSWDSSEIIPIVEYVASCLRSYKDNKEVFIKTRDNYDYENPNSTKKTGLEVLYKHKYLEGDIKEAREVIKYVKDFPEDTTNDYLCNLKSLVACDYSKENHLGLLASLVVFKKNQQLIQELKDKEVLKKISKFQASVGDRITIFVNLVKLTSFDTYFGISHLYEMTDDNHNIYIWKTDRLFTEGRYKVVGTVKEHSTFKEVEQTVLTRCKVEEGDKS